MALIGYAWISTGDQKLPLQHDALNLSADDKLVMWKLDRLGRSMSHLIEKVGELAARAVGFRSHTEQIDTTTSGGKLVFYIFGSLAPFERELICERTNAGSKAARERGRNLCSDANERCFLLKVVIVKRLYSVVRICSIAPFPQFSIMRKRQRHSSQPGAAPYYD
ncbi:recombinase family protein [Sphingomonas sp. NFX23]|uniref:recombinase family protein n=1 Tax=Sphingomonas sp. NFX23 TaxID=2819532 RepID=UPI003CE81636